MRNHRRTITQADVSAAVTALRSELAGLDLTVQPNGYGHRIQCDRCGWSKCHDTATSAKDHAATH